MLECIHSSFSIVIEIRANEMHSIFVSCVSETYKARENYQQ